LKFSINDIYGLFGKKYNEDYKKIWKIYLLIKTNNYNKALILAEELRSDIIVSQYNKLFYDFCMIKIQYGLQMVSDIHVLNLYSNLIDYPSCTDNDSFNMVEISTLIGIVDISSNIGNYDAMNLLYRILTSKTFNYSSSGDSSFLPSIYSSLSRSFGAKEEHHKVLEISQMGIDYCLKHETSNALSHLFIYKSLALLNLDQIEEAKDIAKKCFMQLHIENTPQKYSIFKKIFEKNFNMKIEDLIII